jgi:Putative zinc-finger
MDCKTARLMSEFARPQHVELDAAELQALEAHLAVCPDCARASKQERQADEQFGQAMRKVDVPDRLRSRLLTRLAEDRAAASSRRWKRFATGALAAAAVLVLSISGWMWYHQATLKPLAAEDIARQVNDEGVSPPGPAKLEEAYRQQGVVMAAPTAFNYAFLAHYGMGDLQNKQVPCLLFIRNDDTANIHAVAKVYVVSDRQFNLKNLRTQQSEDGYHYKVEVNHEPGTHFAYVVVHTGENLDWLRRPETNGD